MLERTAGCLESGSLRRLLPASRKSLKSRRTLHSGFWNHAAGDLELPPLWAALVRGADSVAQEPEAAEQKNPTDNGGMLLDFLYPAGTINFLRHYSGWGIDRQDPRWARNGLAKLGQRLYTSSAKDPPLPGQDIHSTDVSEESETDILHGKMGLTRPADYEEAWRQYLLLVEADQKRIRKRLIDYYSTSSRVLDAERTIDLFESVEAEERDAATYQKTIRSHLRLRNLPDAVLLFRTSLETLKVPAGADELLAYLVNLSSWSRACGIWSDVQQLSEEQPQLNYDIYTHVGKLPNVGDLICDLAAYVNTKIRHTIGTKWESEKPEVGKPKATSETTADPPLFDFATTMVQMALFREQSFESARFLRLLAHLLKWRCMTTEVFDRIHKMLVSLNERELLIRCYKKVRGETVIKFHRYPLHSLLKTFCVSHDMQGMQWVLDDFFRCYGKPSQLAYKMCITEFAAQGDATTVHTLFGQYIAQYVSKKHPLRDPDYLSPILQVHSRRGEIDEVIKAFNEVSHTYGLKPTIILWNILISAHCKVHNIDEAFTCFERLLDSPDIKPDDYTLGTLMGICVTRGDLERVIELYRLADDLQIKRSVAMVDCLVLAHIQDNRLQEAEKICVEAVGINLEGTRTRMWNYLIVGYAQNRDLTNANRILQLMSSFNIDPDEFTYAALMQALSMVRQPNECVRIIKEVLPAAGYKVTAFHYAVIMGGYVATREYWRVFQLHRSLRHNRVGQTASTSAMMLRAQVNRDARLFEGGGTEAQQYQRALEMFLDIAVSMDPQDISNTARKIMHRSPLDIAYPTSMYSYIMYVLAESHDIETANGLFERFKNSLPPNRQDNPPILILSTLLLTKWRTRDMDGVEECWNLVLAAAKEEGRPLSPPGAYWENDDPTTATRPKVLYTHQIEIAQCLSWYLKALAYQNLVDKMIVTVEDFIKDGFTLDMRNWNLYIRLLARRKRPKLAFEVCEKYIMPSWTGWSKIRRQLPVRNRLPIEIRALRKNPRHIRPISNTLITLARSYIDIQAAAAESKAYQWLLSDLDRSCPKTVHVIKTMQRSEDEQEREILERF
jgi:pentatricopeptide repeat-containing protein PET309